MQQELVVSNEIGGFEADTVSLVMYVVHWFVGLSEN